MRHLRTKARSMLTLLTSAAAVAVVGLLPGALPAQGSAHGRADRPDAVTAAATSQAYSWKNVQIGGGGFVPGIIFNEGRAGLVYARTDVGGAYRQDPATGKWLDTSAKFRAMRNWPSATTGQVQMNTPPSVVSPSANRVKIPVDGEM